MVGFVDRVIFLPAGAGTGDFVVSAAVQGYNTPAQSNAVDGTSYRYAAQVTDSRGRITDWEVGTGVYTASTTTLARTTVEFSSNNNNKVAFSSPPQVMLTVLAADIGGGGGGTPGGSNTDVQFNNSSSFGGTNDFTWRTGASSPATPKGLQIGGATQPGGSGTAAVTGTSEHAAFGNFGLIDQLTVSPADPVNAATFANPMGVSICNAYNGDFSGAPILADLLVSSSFKFTTNLNAGRAVYVKPVLRSDDSSQHAAVYAAQFDAVNYQSGASGFVDQCIGFLANAFHGGTNTITEVIGAELHAETVSGTNFGTVATAESLLVENEFFGTSGTITQSCGILVNGTIKSVGVTVTDNYGIRLEDQSGLGATGNNANLYSVGANSVNNFEGKIIIGKAATNTGKIDFKGTTSGTVTLSVYDAADGGGAAWTMKLPQTAGTNGYVLQTDGSGNTSWVIQSGSAGTITVGTTTISGGTSGHVVYDAAGIFQEAANFTISSGNPNVTAGNAYLYDGAIAIQAKQASGNWFFGAAGNLTLSGSQDTAIGTNALHAVTSASGTVCIGYSAGSGITTGGNNTIIGASAATALTTGTDNIIIGQFCGSGITTGQNNIVFGTNTANSGTGITNNVIFGVNSGDNLTTSENQNVIFLSSGIPGGNNNFCMLGGSGVGGAGSDNNVALGAFTMGSIHGGASNTAIGASSGSAITTGSQNTCIGNSAGAAITINNSNTCIGASSGGGITTGATNTCIGSSSGTGIVSGGNNICIGANTMTTKGDGNVVIGQNAVGNSNTTNSISSCVIIGNQAAFAAINSSNHVFVGHLAGTSVTTGATNTFIGDSSGNAVTTGSFNSILGSYAGVAAMANCICLSDGQANQRADYNNTNSSKWTFSGANIVVPSQSTAGFIMNDASGNHNSVNTVAAATVAANFTADHRIQITVAGVTYYLPVSTTAW